MLSSSPNTFAVIMAGGTGTRLWPLSRKGKPKQFHAFLSEKTLLQETFERVRRVVPAERIFVSTGQAYRALVLEQLSEITPERLIMEPEARNTGPAICFAAAWITAQFPDAILATIASDHAIKNPEEFEATLLAAFEAVTATPEKIVTVGINPTTPDTGLGYIKLGREFSTVRKHRVFVVDSFKEKPDQKTAEAYLRSFDYLWNAGYFIFAGATLRQWLTQLAPELDGILKKILSARSQGILTDAKLAEWYAEAPNIAFDYLIIEKLGGEQRLVIPSPLEWSDVGNWNTLYEFLKREQGQDRVILGQQRDLGSQDILVHGGKRLITTINVKNLVIIDTEDALLVADRETVGTAIKELLEQLKKDESTVL